jgi:hypothetical protein
MIKKERLNRKILSCLWLDEAESIKGCISYSRLKVFALLDDDKS